MKSVRRINGSVWSELAQIWRFPSSPLHLAPSDSSSFITIPSDTEYCGTVMVQPLQFSLFRGTAPTNDNPPSHHRHFHIIHHLMISPCCLSPLSIGTCTSMRYQSTPALLSHGYSCYTCTPRSSRFCAFPDHPDLLWNVDTSISRDVQIAPPLLSTRYHSRQTNLESTPSSYA